MKIIKERWSSKEADFLELIPFNKIESILNVKLTPRLLLNEDVLRKEPLMYNLAVTARAHNEGMRNELNKYYVPENLKSTNYKDYFDIELDQAFIFAQPTAGGETIALHITKLHRDELFINDVILMRPNGDSSIGNGVFQELLANLTNFCERERIDFISGYASNDQTLEKFLKNGFEIDKRSYRNNHLLYEVSRVKKAQIPFYKKVY